MTEDFLRLLLFAAMGFATSYVAHWLGYTAGFKIGYEAGCREMLEGSKDED